MRSTFGGESFIACVIGVIVGTILGLLYRLDEFARLDQRRRGWIGRANRVRVDPSQREKKSTLRSITI